MSAIFEWMGTFQYIILFIIRIIKGKKYHVTHTDDMCSVNKEGNLQIVQMTIFINISGTFLFVLIL